MSQKSKDLLAVYVDGETKTGKGAAGKAIAAILKENGLQVYYAVAGDFFRRYVALVREYLQLGESDPLPTGQSLEDAAAVVHASRRAYENDLDVGDLQRPIISQSVAILGELPYVQKAGAEWWAMTLQLARDNDTDVLLVDGRNPRYKLDHAAEETGIHVQPVLDLFMTCEAEEAARRTLRLQGIANPTAAELAAARTKIELRRKQDRERSARPFVEPDTTVKYEPAKTTAVATITLSWQPHKQAELPVAIELDNTQFTEDEMISAVRSLALAAIDYTQK